VTVVPVWVPVVVLIVVTRVVFMPVAEL
jgi:ABC-type antimicrobial peptide transport system permease subunit